MKKYQYKDYDEYITTQIETTERKIGRVWARQDSIDIIARFLKKKKFKPLVGMCHGARTGEEIGFFKRHFKKCLIYGTDIAPVCKSDDVILWDFNNTKESWIGRFDFLYSNSWDHLYDPKVGFKIWLKQVKRGGYLILEHSEQHIDKKVDIVDSCGMKLSELVKYIGKIVKKNFKLQLSKGNKFLQMPFRHGHAVIWKRVR